MTVALEPHYSSQNSMSEQESDSGNSVQLSDLRATAHDVREAKMKKLLLLVLVLVFGLVACACGSNVAPGPESDSDQVYAGGKIPVDDNVYRITGKVVGDVESLTRVGADAQYRQYDAVAVGSYWMEQSGKGFVRLSVRSCEPPIPEIQSGDIVILKTTDSKTRALIFGDFVRFKCRLQYEAVAAVRINESFDVGKVGTWELDYCRIIDPVIVPNAAE